MRNNLPNGYWTTVYENFTDGVSNLADLVWAAPSLAKSVMSTAFNIAASPMWNWPVTLVGTTVAFAAACSLSRPFANGVLAAFGARDNFRSSAMFGLLALGFTIGTTFGVYTMLDALDAPDRPRPPVTAIEPDSYGSSDGLSGDTESPNEIPQYVLPPRLDL